MVKSSQSQPAARLSRLAARTRSLYQRAPRRFIAAVVLAAFAGYVLFLSIHVITAFEGRRWDLPAHVYAAPLELYAGAPVTSEELVASLRQTGYQQVPHIATPGEFAVDGDGVALWTRPFRHCGSRCGIARR